MKLALISPRSAFLGRNTRFREFAERSEEMEFYRRYWSGLGSGLLVVAALTPEHVEISLTDENIEEIDFDAGYDLAAVTAMTQQAPRAYEIAGAFRERGVRVVLGGIHATVLPGEAARHADSVVAGEAESCWKELLDDFSRGELKPVYASGGEADLAESPVPRYELLEGKPYRIVWVQAGRGCPHDCSFCCASRVYGSAYRTKAPGRVIEEIERIRRVHRHAMIGFADDNLFADRAYAREILERLVDLKARWIGQSDVSVGGDEELLKLARRSGCVVLLVGFESLAEENLRDGADWKMKRVKDYAAAAGAIQASGIGVIGTFIVGFDHDDASTFDRIADFVIDNRLAGAQIAALTPFPRTRLRDTLEREDRILDTPWDNYTFYDANIRPRGMSAGELEEGILHAFERVYAPGIAAEKGKHFMNIFAEVRGEGRS